MKTHNLEEIRKILKDEFKTLILVDYCYECDSTPYFYKIYKFINDYGEPLTWPVIAVRYDEFTGEEIRHVVGHRQYKRSYRDYETYEKALESGIEEAKIMATILSKFSFDALKENAITLSEDAKQLLDNGFVFTRYLATEYTEYELETVFIKETALAREEIDFFSLMNNKI